MTTPARALDRILRAAGRADAERRMRQLLADAWQHGNLQGFSEGQADATQDDPPLFPPNPYRDRK